MLSVKDWAEIRWLHRAEGLPIKQIAWVVGAVKGDSYRLKNRDLGRTHAAATEDG